MGLDEISEEESVQRRSSSGLSPQILTKFRVPVQGKHAEKTEEDKIGQH